MRDNPLSEEKLREAAREYLRWELQKFDAYADYPEPDFHGTYKLQMAALRHDVKQGNIKEAKYRMGATFYLKRSIAAILLVFTMACLTMPETVLAGYQKLIEVIETVFEEYTEYRYRVNDVGAIEEEFKPIKLGYLPEGMELVRYLEVQNRVDLLYEGLAGEKLSVYQRNLGIENVVVHHLDTEDINLEKIIIKGEEVELLVKDNRINFVWQHGSYYIGGQANIGREELILILNEMKF